MGFGQSCLPGVARPVRLADMEGCLVKGEFVERLDLAVRAFLVNVLCRAPR